MGQFSPLKPEDGGASLSDVLPQPHRGGACGRKRLEAPAALLFPVSLGAPQHLSLCFPNYEKEAEAGALCGLQGGVGEAITGASLTASFLPPPPCSEGRLPAALVCPQLWDALEPRAAPSSRRASFDRGRRARGQFPGQLQTNPKEMGSFSSKAR